MIPHNRYLKIWLYYLFFGALGLALSACSLPASLAAPNAVGDGTLAAYEEQTAIAQSTAVAATVSAL